MPPPPRYPAGSRPGFRARRAAMSCARKPGVSPSPCPLLEPPCPGASVLRTRPTCRDPWSVARRCRSEPADRPTGRAGRRAPGVGIADGARLENGSRTTRPRRLALPRHRSPRASPRRPLPTGPQGLREPEAWPDAARAGHATAHRGVIARLCDDEAPETTPWRTLRCGASLPGGSLGGRASGRWRRSSTSRRIRWDSCGSCPVPCGPRTAR